MHHKLTGLIALHFLLFVLFSSLNVAIGGGGGGEEKSPFSPKAHLIRYWNKHIQNKVKQTSEFFISKASPLSAVDSAVFTKLAAENALSTCLPEFCSSANLLCSPELGQSLEKHGKDASFSSYASQNFTNYAPDRNRGADTFKNYSGDGGQLQLNSFAAYSRGSKNHDDRFSLYGPDGNGVSQRFNAYGTGSTKGTGDFKKYGKKSNVPEIRFTSYSEGAGGRKQRFKSYSDGSNFVSQGFETYGRNADEATNEFGSYATKANLMGTGFSGYSEGGKRGKDTFSSYGNDNNIEKTEFNSYGDGGDASVEEFKSYRVDPAQGEDSFDSYARNSKNEVVNFANYGESFSFGEDNFTSYGKGSTGQTIGFKVYSDINNFREYTKDKEGVTFATYNVTHQRYTTTATTETTSMAVTGSTVKRRVEPGKFFRESMMKTGVVMPMPDIRDKMPKRSFLPRTISSKLPFSSSKIDELKRIFHADDGSAIENMMMNTMEECERVPSKGETKCCVSSAEDMIDFATSVLGRNIAVRSTEKVRGSNKKILIGSVKGINGGKVTESVSCHQSLFPYLVYYCHSVPKVRVYEAEILDPISKAKINNGVAICHLDTSAWSPTHGAFLAVGSSPGRIEVCHWIFENDMTWTVAH